MINITLVQTETGPTWKDVVADAIASLGGEAHLKQISEKLKNHEKTKTNPTWRDTIRRVVRQYAIFQPIGEARSGRYRLVAEPKVDPKPARAHDNAQGMLLALGKLYGYQTFAPAADCTRREFQCRPLRDYATVRQCDSFAQGSVLRTVSQIDVMWLAEDSSGPYPVFAFEVEHSTKVKSGMDRMTEIPERCRTKMFIVAPGADEERLFARYFETNRFRRFQKQMFFRNYEELDSLYATALQHESVRSSFGVEPMSRG